MGRNSGNARGHQQLPDDLLRHLYLVPAFHRPQHVALGQLSPPPVQASMASFTHVGIGIPGTPAATA